MGLYEEWGSKVRTETKCQGILTALVKENWDKDHKGKVKVEFFLGEQGKNETAWIPVAAPYTASGAGTFFLPEVGSEVVVAFVNGNYDKPIVIGSLWNDQKPLGDTFVTEKNTIKTIRTAAGHEILFDETEDKGQITIQTAGKLKVNLADEKKVLTVSDDKAKTGLTIDFENGKIALKAEKEMTFTIGSKDLIKLEDGTVTIKTDTVKLEGSQSLSMKGQNTEIRGGNSLNLKSDAAMEIKAGATLKAEGSAMTELKGGMVKIN